jgi:hypothetical protein
LSDVEVVKQLCLSVMVLAGSAAFLQADATLVFNEVMYHPATNEPAMEWVELYNQLAVDLDVSGWRISGEIDYTFPPNTRVPGRGFVVVSIDPAALGAATGITNVVGPFAKRLSNSGGTLRLRNNNDRLVDQMTYGTEGDWPVAPDGAGPSLAKLDEDFGSSFPGNWGASRRIGGTPGTRNDVPTTNLPPAPATALPLAFNEISSATNAQFWIELINYGPESVPLENFVLARFGSNYREYLLPAQTLAPGGFLVLDRAIVGFGADPGDRVVLYAPEKTGVIDAVVAKRFPRGRSPDGTGAWLVPDVATPGASNRFHLSTEIVINEIMYQHKRFPSKNGLAPQPNPEEWIELFNRGTNAVDLTNWQLTDAIQYVFPPGTTLGPGAYLVVAKDGAALRAKYPEIEILGNFGGRLSSSGERLLLLDAIGNPADEVHYHSWGRWPRYPAGGGSSLELRDPHADNSKAEAWAASDESGKSVWQSFSYRMVAQPSLVSAPDTQWREFLLGLLAAGECLIDDISVLQSPSGNPVQMIENGDFENGLAGWRVLGTHRNSRVIPEPGNSGNRVLHLIATGPQEHMHNHIVATLASGRSVVNGEVYEISFRAKWLAGSSLLNTRFWFNRAAKTSELAVPEFNGTPGARNSRYETNIGPALAQLRHEPVVPPANASVTVSVVAEDPQGIGSCQLFWSVNGGPFSSVPMTSRPGGLYIGIIPGYAAGTLVQFYVRATDGLGAAAAFPARGANGGAFYKVNDGQANLSQGHNIRILLTPANTSLLHAPTNVMSNGRLPCTVIYDERIAYYDVALRLKGSMNGRPHSARVGFHLTFQPDDLFRGVHPAMGMDRRPGDNLPRNEEIVVRHAALHAGGVPTMQMDICRVLAPRAAENGPAILTPSYEDRFIETSFENGGDGTLFEMELIYYSTTADAAGYKLPQPNTSRGTEIADHGNDKERYRYNFVLKNHRSADDFSQFIAFAKPFGLSGTALETQTRQMMDIDQWLRAYAIITLFGVNDTYSFWLNHNLMIYFRPSDQKAVYLMWDSDFAFARSATSAIVGDQNLGKIVNLPSNLRVLYAHLLDIMETTYNPGYMGPWLAHYGPFSGANYTGRTNYIQQRSDHVRSVIASAGGNTAFRVNSTNITVTSGNLATLSGSAPVQVKTITVNGVEWPVTWTGLTSWTVRVPVTEPANLLRVAGMDLRGNPVPNTSVTVAAFFQGTTDSPGERIVFNEIMYNPIAPGAEFVELFNTSSGTAFDLSGWRVDELNYAFPSGSILGPRSYLVLGKNRSVFTATYGNQTPLFDLFGRDLRLNGQILTLLQPGAVPTEDSIVDKVRYEPVRPWPVGSNDVRTASSIQLLDAAQDNSRPLNWQTRYSQAVWSEGVFSPGVTNEGWTFFSWSAIPNTTSGDLKLFLGSPGTLFLDDITFVPGIEPGAGENLLVNGDFENGAMAPWTAQSGATNSTVTAAAARSGSYGLELKVAGSAGTPARIQQRLNDLTPGSPYTLSFWYFTTVEQNQLQFHLTSDFRTGLAENPPIETQRTSIPPSYTPPQLISPAVVTHTPGGPNTGVTALAPIPPLWLNELQPVNLSGITDSTGRREPWIELYNAGSNPVSLSGFYLTDNYINLTQWAFPAGASIGPGEFKIIFADGRPHLTTDSEWHTSFRLSSATGAVALVRVTSQAEVLDYINYTNVPPDASYGAFPDGQPFTKFGFSNVTPGASNDDHRPPAVVFINEWMAANTRTLADPADGAYDDWFELYNPGDHPVDLDGYYLTDTLANPFKYRITTEGPHIIPARGHLLVWADNEPGQNLAGGIPRQDLHVNFALAAAGEAIGLFAPDGAQIDAVVFGPQTADVSMGRYPDGSATIVSMPGTATPRGPNRIDFSPGPLRFIDAVRQGESLEFTWETQAGQSYAVDYTETLNPPAWIPLWSNVATGEALTFTTPMTNAVQRFFRLRSQ